MAACPICVFIYKNHIQKVGGQFITKNHVQKVGGQMPSWPPTGLAA